MGKYDGLVRYADEAGDAVRSVIRAFHGSPSGQHFDKFDAAHIGSGEGNQAYSYGHYSAQDPAIADWYRKNLSRRRMRNEWREELADDSAPEDVQWLIDTGYFDDRQAKLLRALGGDDWLGFDYPSQAVDQALSPSGVKNYDPSPELADAVKNIGTGYELEIGVQPHTLLDWDRPLSVQPHARDAVVKIADQSPDSQARGSLRSLIDADATGKAAYHGIADTLYDPNAIAIGGRRTVSRIDASRALHESGVPGVQYLDANSRGSGQGLRNVVVFPGAEDSIRILRKYAIPGAVGTGVASQYEEER
jgi:hypothetical protein